MASISNLYDYTHVWSTPGVGIPADSLERWKNYLFTVKGELVKGFTECNSLIINRLAINKISKELGVTKNGFLFNIGSEWEEGFSKKHLISGHATMQKLTRTQLSLKAASYLNEVIGKLGPIEHWPDGSFGPTLCGVASELSRKIVGYRDRPVIVLKKCRVPTEIASVDDMIPFLKKQNPDDESLKNTNNDALARYYTKAYLSEKLNPIEEEINLRDGSPVAKVWSSYISIVAATNSVPRRVEKLYSDLKKLISRGDRPSDIAAYAHMMIVKIHPFFDGNGRTARFFMNLILKNYGLPPIIFYSKSEYTKAVEEALLTKDFKPFRELVRREVYCFERLHAIAKKTFGNNPGAISNFISYLGMFSIDLLKDKVQFVLIDEAQQVIQEANEQRAKLDAAAS